LIFGFINMLEKQIVSINLAKGIDESASDVLPRTDSFKTIENVEYDKLGQAVKRRAIQETNLTLNTNPQNITLDANGDVISIGPKAFINGEGLFVENTQGTYNFRHNVTKSRYEVFSNIEFAGKCMGFDSVDIGTHIICNYVIFNTPLNTIEARVSIINKANGQLVVANQLLQTNTITGSDIVNFYRPEAQNVYAEAEPSRAIALKFATKTVLFFSIGAQKLSGSTLFRYVEVNNTTLALGSMTTWPSVGYPIRVFDFAACGLRAVTNATSNNLRLIDDTLTITHATPSASIPANTSLTKAPWNIYYSRDLDRLYAACIPNQLFNSNQIEFYVIQVLASSSTLIASPTTAYINSLFFQNPSENITRPGWAYEPGYSYLGGSRQGLWYDDWAAGNVKFLLSSELEGLTRQYTFTNAALTTTTNRKTTSFAAVLPFGVRDTFKKRFFGLSWFKDVLLSEADTREERDRALFLLDLQKQNVNSEHNVVNRFSDFAAILNFQTQEITYDSNTQTEFILPSHEFTSFDTNFGYDKSAIVFYKFNINQADRSYTEVLGSNQKLINPGPLCSFDDTNVFEVGFFHKPQRLSVTRSFTFTGLQYASGELLENSNTERRTFFPSGDKIIAANGTNAFRIEWNYFDASWQTLSIFYRVDGVGTAGPATPSITVDISRDDSAFEVAAKTFAVLSSGSAPGLALNSFARVLPDGSIARLAPTATPGPAGSIAFNVGNGLPAGTYTLKHRFVFYDEKGTEYRSQFSDPISIVLPEANAIFVNSKHTYLTNKNLNLVATEVYQTQTNGTIFYKTSIPGNGLEYSSLRYWVYGRATINGTAIVPNASLNLNEVAYDTGGVLQNGNTPCNVKHIGIYKDRIFVSRFDKDGIVSFSKPIVSRLDSDFPTEFFIDLATKNDFVQGIGNLEDKLVVFTNQAIIAISGDGPNDLGTQATFSLPYYVSTTEGCSNPLSILKTDSGIFFKADSGYKMLGSNLQIQNIGLAVRDIDHELIGSTVLYDDAERKYVLIISKDVTKPTLIYDINYGLWGIFTNFYGFSGVFQNGSFLFYRSTAKLGQFNDASYRDDSTGSYRLKIVTNWMSVNQVQGFQRISRMLVLGINSTTHNMIVKTYYNYDMSAFNTYQLPSSSLVVSGGYGAGTYQAQFQIARQKVESLKVEIELEPTGSNNEKTATLTDLTFYLGIKKGAFKIGNTKKA
jgi:hypothetical protein